MLSQVAISCRAAQVCSRSGSAGRTEAACAHTSALLVLQFSGVFQHQGFFQLCVVNLI